jgi:hypothetical protein
MSTKRRSEASPGDLIGIPLDDETVAVAQVFGVELDCAVTPVRLALTDLLARSTDSDLEPLIEVKNYVAVLLATSVTPTDRSWPVIGRAPIRLPQVAWPYEEARARRFIRVPMKNVPLVNSIARALWGRYPWDGKKDPLYFEKLLLPGVVWPRERLVFRPQ